VRRKSDCINVGGAKVYPLEVEAVIRGVRGVREVVVKERKSSCWRKELNRPAKHHSITLVVL
jgi:acyl-CoA synthetase (AMP-forming)/AMP-acid ligase II